jgi:hypothetical protein
LKAPDLIDGRREAPTAVFCRLRAASRCQLSGQRP